LNSTNRRGFSYRFARYENRDREGWVGRKTQNQPPRNTTALPEIVRMPGTGFTNVFRPTLSQACARSWKDPLAPIKTNKNPEVTVLVLEN